MSTPYQQQDRQKSNSFSEFFQQMIEITSWQWLFGGAKKKHLDSPFKEIDSMNFRDLRNVANAL
jgi:hypothetical protein